MDNRKPHDSSAALFQSETKDVALKILLGYSASTGHKWTHIRKEIFAAVGADIIKDGSLLTRQDLEHWAAGHNTIGDAKFGWVFRFLTAEATISRPYFAGMLPLLAPSSRHEKEAFVLGGFYSDFERSVFLRSGLRDLRPPAEAISALWSGVWQDQDPRAHSFLELSHSSDEDVLIAELWNFPRGLPSGNHALDVDRDVGYMTIGTKCIIHLKSVDRRRTRVLFAYPGSGRSLVLVSDEVADRAQMLSRLPLEERHRRKDGYDKPLIDERGLKVDPFTINPEHFSRRYLRSSFSHLREIIDICGKDRRDGI